MNSVRALVLVFVTAYSSLSSATFVPENEINYRRLSRGPANMAEAQFRQIISQLQTAYTPIVTGLGGRLSINGDWRSEKLNAGANQMFGNWMVQITGGLARRPELTPDGFTLILCHELGHHLAGFSFAPGDNPFSGVWAANEGQADYFATQVCARKIWGQDLAVNAGFRQSATSEVKSLCDQVWSGANDQDLCYRVLTASASLIATMAHLMGQPIPQFETPDPTVVSETNSKHPAVQCRMDTSLQGALCLARHDERVIPGKKAPGGEFSLEAERAAAQHSCMVAGGYSVGLRPACWFKARM